MRILYLAVLSLLAPLSLFSADMHLRFARVTLAEGRVDVEAAVTGERVPAERNVPVGEGYWVETGAGKAEVELDEGRSEERRVGKECRCGWWGYHEKKKKG